MSDMMCRPFMNTALIRRIIDRAHRTQILLKTRFARACTAGVQGIYAIAYGAVHPLAGTCGLGVRP
jgi:hypothetical protein